MGNDERARTHRKRGESVERQHGSALLAAEGHLRKYLLAYTIVIILIAIPVGYMLRGFNASHTSLFYYLLLFFAIMIIYPSMMQLRTEGEHLTRAFKSWKVIVAALAYIFVVAPVMAFFLGPYLGSGIGTGFFITNIVPASSSALGYVLIVGGSIEMATVITIASLSAAVLLMPIFLGIYSMTGTAIPLVPILESIFYVLVVPLVLGQITRKVIYKKKGEAFINKGIRPYLTLITMIAMFFMIFLMVENEANEIVMHPVTVGLLIGFQLVIMLAVIVLATLIDMRMKFSYEQQQAVAIISMAKNLNISAAIAIVTAIPGALVPPALLRIVQPVVSVAYIKLEGKIRRLFPVEGTKAEIKKEERIEKMEKKKEGTIGELGEGEMD